MSQSFSRIGFYSICALGVSMATSTAVRAVELFSENFEAYAEGSNLFGQGGWADHPIFGNFAEETLVGQGAGLGSKVSNGRINTGSGMFGYAVQPIAAPSSSDIYTLSFDAFAYSTEPESHVALLGFVFDDGSLLTWQAGNNPDGDPPLINAWRFTVDNVTGDHADNTFYQGGFDRPVQFEIVIDAVNLEFYGRYDFGAGFQSTPTFALTQSQVDELNGLCILNDYRRPNNYLGVELDNILLSRSGPDSDNDGIPDDQDNCPTVTNSDQSNVDGDLLGDACDPDIDGDGILNGNDNCPYDANPAQADVDGDGAGDVCDDDIDGDGVIDADDACVPTPVGEAVDAAGCSISQLCPCDNAWKNHGAYVRCVAHSSVDFVADGLITEAEKDVIVSEVAQSDCGHE